MSRRSILTLLLLAAELCAAGGPPLVTAVDAVALTVSDLDRSEDFYSKVLSFEKMSET